MANPKTSWLDGKHVVFGKVVDGYSVVKEMEKVGSDGGRTSSEVVIEDCGECTHTRNSYFLNDSSVIILRRRNKRRAPNVVEPELRTIVQVAPMADNRTMEELLQAPTEGFEETFGEAWERFKEMLRACPHHEFTKLTQIDTFYNGLNDNDQDFLNAVAGGNLLIKTTREALQIIKNELKVLYSRNKPNVSRINTTSRDNASKMDDRIDKLVDQISTFVDIFAMKVVTPAPVKAVEESCFKCGGAHAYYNCPNTDSNQPSVCVTTGTYNQVAPQNRASNYMKPPGFAPVQNSQNSFVDALPLMPKFASMIKSLLTNKDKLFELAKIPLNDNCSAMLLKKLPEELGDPGKFLIPCDFPRMDVCHALADLSASINLMPLTIWKKFSLPELTPTRMTLKLVDRSITHPKGVAKDVFVKVGKFHFPTDFVVVDFEADPRVPLILGRSFLRTGHALIDVYREEITIQINDEAVTFNLNQTTRYSSTYDDLSVNRIAIIDVTKEEYAQEILGFSYNSSGGNPTSTFEPILSDSSSSLTSFEGSDFILEEIKAYLKDESILPEINHADCDPEGDICLIEKLLNNDPFQLPLMDLKEGEVVKAKSSIEEPLELKLKDLPSHLEYAYLEGVDKLPVINAKDLKVDEKEALLKVLKSHKKAIAWKITNIKGIDPQFSTHKILKEEDYKPAVQTVNQKFMRCEDTNLVLNWEKCHFMVKEGIVLGHKISKNGLEVNRAKVDVIAKLPHPTTVKDFANFHAVNFIVKGMSSQQKKKFFKDGIDFMGPFPSSRGNSGQVEVSNRGLKSILEMTVGENRASWSEKLDDALWDFRTSYKIPIGCTPYKLVYGKSCHLPIELEHKAYWALKHVNFDLRTTGDHQKLQLDELNELHDQDYENSLIYKEKTKKLHDSKIKNRIFNVGDWVLLFNSHLKIFLRKLKTHRSGPFTITKVFPYGTVELSQPDGPNFKVNGHHVKHYFRGDIPQLVVLDL
nr:reverse transcriptase domain-containing protein [Tanacetum cinerariifolium]